MVGVGYRRAAQNSRTTASVNGKVGWGGGLVGGRRGRVVRFLARPAHEDGHMGRVCDMLVHALANPAVSVATAPPSSARGEQNASSRTGQKEVVRSSGIWGRRAAAGALSPHTYLKWERGHSTLRPRAPSWPHAAATRPSPSRGLCTTQSWKRVSIGRFAGDSGRTTWLRRGSRGD